MRVLCSHSTSWVIAAGSIRKSTGQVALCVCLHKLFEVLVMGKRVSAGGGGSAPKKANAKTGTVAKLPHVAKIIDWFFGFENFNVKIKSVVLLLQTELFGFCLRSEVHFDCGTPGRARQMADAEVQDQGRSQTGCHRQPCTVFCLFSRMINWNLPNGWMNRFQLQGAAKHEPSFSLHFSCTLLRQDHLLFLRHESRRKTSSCLAFRIQNGLWSSWNV